MARPVALVLTLLTGFSGLVYEVAWQKLLAILVGSHAEATAAVLGLYLGGLAVGYRVFGDLTQRLARRASAEARTAPVLALYGAVEVGIGLYAFCFPLLFEGVQALSSSVGFGAGGAGFAFDLLLCALLVVPPTVLMGGTIPMLTQALARGLYDATRIHALVYAFNTAGAFAGAVAAGFWLVPALGLSGVLYAMGAVNLAAGAIFVVLGRVATARHEAAPCEPDPALAAASHPLGRFAAIALLSGFAAMTLQASLNRIAALAFGSSHFTFAMVVAVFVLCIAFGSFAVSSLPRIPSWLLPATLWGQVLSLLLLFGILEEAPYWVHRLRTTFGSEPGDFYAYYLSALGWLFWVLAIPVALSGATLPLLFDGLRRETGELGGTAGRLYSWNTAGSLLGALLGGYALLFLLDLDQVFRVALIAASAAGALAIGRPRGSPFPAVVALCVALIPVLALPAWSVQRLTSGLFRQREPLPYTSSGPDAFFARHPLDPIVFHRDDPTATITVAESRSGSDRSIITNGKSDSSARGDYVTTALLALVPALLAEKAERAFVVGYGTGVTAGEFASLDSAKEVVVAEISRGVIEAAPLFDALNGDVSNHERIRLVHADAYRSLLRTEGTFDAILSEPSNPWVTGVEMLYSREFLEAARDRLAPGGVYGQWIHTYEIDAETLSLVLRTYREVFPYVSVWFTKGNDLQLLGFRSPRSALDVERVLARAQRPDFARALARAGVGDGVALLAHELVPIGVVHAASMNGPLHTLLHPRLSDLAARAFFTGRQAKLPSSAALETARVGHETSLVRRLFRIRGAGAGEVERATLVLETCRYRPPECATLIAEWRHADPESRERARVEEALARIRDRIAIPEKMVASLTLLYGDPPPPERSALAVARESTARFQLFYHHAAPFSRAALAALWDRCESDPEQRAPCIERRRDAEGELGDLRIGLDPS